MRVCVWSFSFQLCDLTSQFYGEAAHWAKQWAKSQIRKNPEINKQWRNPTRGNKEFTSNHFYTIDKKHRISFVDGDDAGGGGVGIGGRICGRISFDEMIGILENNRSCDLIRKTARSETN